MRINIGICGLPGVGKTTMIGLIRSVKVEKEYVTSSAIKHYKVTFNTNKGPIEACIIDTPGQEMDKQGFMAGENPYLFNTRNEGLPEDKHETVDAVMYMMEPHSKESHKHLPFAWTEMLEYFGDKSQPIQNQDGRSDPKHLLISDGNKKQVPVVVVMNKAEYEEEHRSLKEKDVDFPYTKSLPYFQVSCYRPHDKDLHKKWGCMWGSVKKTITKNGKSKEKKVPFVRPQEESDPSSYVAPLLHILRVITGEDDLGFVDEHRLVV